MRILDNCRKGGPDWFECPFLRLPMFHSGFTGKSGPETWWSCLKRKAYMRDIDACDLSGKPEEQTNAWIDFKVAEAKSNG